MANRVDGSDTSADITPTPQPGVVYFLDDHQGNTHLVTDSVGNIVHEESWYPYGVKRYEQNSADDSEAVVESKPYYSYTGKEYDVETGLIYFGGRYYAPELGRWITPDPLFLEKDPKKITDMPKEMNLYAYVQGNPIVYSDPTGMNAVHEFLENTATYSAIAGTAAVLTPGGQPAAVVFFGITASSTAIDVALYSETPVYDTFKESVKMVIPVKEPYNVVVDGVIDEIADGARERFATDGSATISRSISRGNGYELPELLPDVVDIELGEFESIGCSNSDM